MNTALLVMPTVDVSQLPPSVYHARRFAMAAHGDQKYGDKPYVSHLDDVAALLQPYGEELMILAYLHDFIEDTAGTKADVAQVFSADMAILVDLISDEDGKNRKERKAKTHAKLAAIDATDQLRVKVLIAKVADRLGNVLRCVLDGNDGLLSMYRKEHPAFREAVYRDGVAPELWERVDALIAG